MKAVVAAFNQEKALVGAFSVIVQPVMEPMDRFTALVGSYSVTSLWPEVTPVTGLTNHIVFAPQVDNVLTKLMASLQRGLLLCSSLTINL